MAGDLDRKKSCPLSPIGGVFFAMMPDDSKDLLRRYARDRSEAAFHELVRLHSGVVYSTALRSLGGDRATAQDVMQEVFTLLARKAPSLENVVLSAWLYRQTCRRASNLVRTEDRRRKRELLAIEAMSSSPISGDDSRQALTTEIDRALLALPSPDRDALVLRFFDDRDYRRVGDALGIGEEAARKRVTRALEKLTAILRRKGIVAGAASLGPAMTGMAAVQPPAAMTSAVASQALKSAPAGAAGSTAGWARPFLAGLFAASAAAGGIALSRHPSSGEGAVANSSPPPSPYRREKAASVDGSDFDALIASIKRLQSAPAHALTGLRLDALLEALPSDQTPAFISFADGKLTQEEKKSCYKRLIARWMKADPSAAVNFTVDQKIPAKLGESNSNLAIAVFGDWARRDSAAAGEWLITSWSNSSLSAFGLGGSLRYSLAGELLDDRLRRGEVEGALAFVPSLPVKDRRSVLENLIESSVTSLAWTDLAPEKRLELYRRIAALSDPALAGVAGSLLDRWASNHPDELRDQSLPLSPTERFAASLHLAGVVTPKIIDFGDGIVETSSGPPANVSFHEIEKSYLSDGMASGLSRSDALKEIAEVVIARQIEVHRVGDDLPEWLESHRRDGVDLDGVLASTASSEATAAFAPAKLNGYGLENALRLSGCIQDPALRGSLCRAVVQTILVTNPGLTTASLKQMKMPDDLVDELQARFSLKP